MNKSLQLAIINNLASVSMTHHERLASSCILYRYINTIIDVQKNTNSVSSLVSSYSGNVLNRISTLKNHYLAYNLMIQEVNKIDKESFYNYTDNDIMAVYNHYLNRTKLVDFSVETFKQAMYKIDNLTHFEYNKLKKIHKNIMCPICLYYVETAGILESDMEIYSVKASDEDIIGNEITFSIKNITPSRIINDLKNDRIIITYNSVYSDGTYVKILL